MSTSILTSIKNWILEQFAATPGVDTTISPPPLMPPWEVGHPAQSGYDIGAFISEGYLQNVVISACVAVRNHALVEPPLGLKRRKAKSGTVEEGFIEDHPIYELISDPALANNQDDEDSSKEVMEMWWASHDCTGNAYLLMTRADGDPFSTDRLPSRLDVLMPQFMSPIREADGKVRFYRYENGSIKYDFPAANIIHMKNLPDLKNKWLGVTPIAIAARQGELDNRLADYLLSLMSNGGFPGLILRNTKFDLTDEEKMALRQMIQERFSLKKAGGAMVLGPNMELVDPVGVMGPKDMMAPDILKYTESRIAMMFEVPVEVLGAFSGIDAKYSNYETGRLIFHDKLMPTFTKGQIKFSQLAKQFDPNLYFEYNWKEVAWLQSSSKEQRDQWLAEFRCGARTYHQFCEVNKLDPVGEDFRLIENSVTLTPAEVEIPEKQELPPAPPKGVIPPQLAPTVIPPATGTELPVEEEQQSKKKRSNVRRFLPAPIQRRY